MLALQLGHASPSRMLAEMRPSELGLWAALWESSPWGEERADIRAGLTTLHVAASWLKRTDGKDWRLDDFLPFQRRMIDKAAADEALSKRLRAALGALSGHKAKAKS